MMKIVLKQINNSDYNNIMGKMIKQIIFLIKKKKKKIIFNEKSENIKS